MDRAISVKDLGWGNMSTDGRGVGGMALRQRILADKRSLHDKTKSPQPLGGRAQARLAFGVRRRRKGGHSQLVVQNAGEVVRESLIMAITASQTLNSSQRSRGPLQQWLLVEAKPNQRELAGLIKAGTVARPATSVATASLVVA